MTTITINDARNFMDTYKDSTGLASGATHYYFNTYVSTMKRKTVTEADRKALEFMKAMIANIEETMNNNKEK